jgi:hypothetical protein
MPQIYIYNICGVDIFIHRTYKKINHLSTDKIFCPQKQIGYAPNYNLVANKNLSQALHALYKYFNPVSSRESRTLLQVNYHTKLQYCYALTYSCQLPVLTLTIGGECRLIPDPKWLVFLTCWRTSKIGPEFLEAI